MFLEGGGQTLRPRVSTWRETIDRATRTPTPTRVSLPPAALSRARASSCRRVAVSSRSSRSRYAFVLHAPDADVQIGSCTLGRREKTLALVPFTLVVITLSGAWRESLVHFEVAVAPNVEPARRRGRAGRRPIPLTTSSSARRRLVRQRVSFARASFSSPRTVGARPLTAPTPADRNGGRPTTIRGRVLAKQTHQQQKNTPQNTTRNARDAKGFFSKLIWVALYSGVLCGGHAALHAPPDPADPDALDFGEGPLLGGGMPPLAGGGLAGADQLEELTLEAGLNNA